MKNIIYTATIADVYHHGNFIKLYKINRFFNDKKIIIKITNHLLQDDTQLNQSINKDFFDLLKDTESHYDKFLKNTWFDIKLYYYTNVDTDFKNNVDNLVSYKDFKNNKLDEIFWNLLFAEGTEQMKWAILYCNHDNFNIKMIACDLLRNKDIIEFKNKKMLQYILQGKIDLLEELTQ